LPEILCIKNGRGHPMVPFVIVIGFWTLGHMKH